MRESVYTNLITSWQTALEDGPSACDIVQPRAVNNI